MIMFLLDILDIIQIPENNRKSISKPYNVFLNNTRFIYIPYVLVVGFDVLFNFSCFKNISDVIYDIIATMQKLIVLANLILMRKGTSSLH